MGSSPSIQAPACSCKRSPPQNLPYEVYDAAKKGLSGPVLQHLRKGDVNAKYRGETMLHVVCAEGRENVLTILLSKKTLCLNLRNNYNETALMLAASKGYRDCVEVLLVHNHNCSLEFDCKNNYGHTATDLAHISNHQEVAYCLVTYRRNHLQATGGHVIYDIPPPTIKSRQGPSPQANK